MSVASKSDSGVEQPPTFGTGCLVCGSHENDDKILLCEACDGEYHMYCLKPPLKRIPKDDWYCAKCASVSDDDGLDKLVAKLPPHITSRYGEICWAQGGSGYGWWPSIIYDPRFTVEPARSEARRQLGKMYLVYFFCCPDSPFSVLPEKKLKTWWEGLSEDAFHGRAAKSVGKERFGMFKEAMQIACLEIEKPVSQRLDWEQNEGPKLLSPSPPKLPGDRRSLIEDDVPTNIPEPRGLFTELGDDVPKSISRIKRRRKPVETLASLAKATASSSVAWSVKQHPENDAVSSQVLVQPSDRKKRQRLPATKDSTANEGGNKRHKRSKQQEESHATPRKSNITDSKDSRVVFKIIHRSLKDKIAGYVVLESRLTATFADVRVKIQSDLDKESDNKPWKFLLPNAGKPVSLRQETALGPVYELFRKASEIDIGEGTISDPVEILIVPN